MPPQRRVASVGGDPTRSCRQWCGRDVSAGAEAPRLVGEQPLSNLRLPALAATLATAMAVAGLPNSVFGVLSTFLLDTFEITRSQFGLLVAASNAVAATLAPTAGRITDRLGGRTSIATLFVIGIVTLLALSTAPSYLWLAAAALLAGLLNALANPGTNHLIAALVPAGKRGVVMGVKQSGVQVGLTLAGAYLPAASVVAGWRTALASMTVLPVVGLVATLLGVPRDRRAPAASSAVNRPGRYRHPPGIRWLAVYAFLMGAGQGALQTFLPLYTQEAMNWTVTAAGAAAALLGLLGVIFRIIWGRSSERARHIALPLSALAALAVIATGLLLAAPGLPPLAWAGVVLAGASVAAWNAVVMLAVVIESASHHTGRASGLVIFGFMGGFTAGPFLFGASVDLTNGYGLGWMSVAAVFSAAFAVTRLWDAGRAR